MVSDADMTSRSAVSDPEHGYEWLNGSFGTVIGSGGCFRDRLWSCGGDLAQILSP